MSVGTSGVGIDITEFVKSARQQLLDAIGAAGIAAEDLREICHKEAPFGSWKLPVIIFSKQAAGALPDRPVARYWLTYPEVNGQKSVKFNIDTFHEISKWLNQQPSPQTSPSSTTVSPSSF